MTNRDIAVSFVKQYYEALANQDVGFLVSLYRSASTLVSSNGAIFNTLDSIKAAISAQVSVESLKYKITGIGAYSAPGDSVLVLVRGVSLGANAALAFAQTFILAPEPGAPVKGHFVFTDVVESITAEAEDDSLDEAAFAATQNTTNDPLSSDTVQVASVADADASVPNGAHATEEEPTEEEGAEETAAGSLDATNSTPPAPAPAAAAAEATSEKSGAHPKDETQPATAAPPTAPKPSGWAGVVASSAPSAGAARGAAALTPQVVRGGQVPQFPGALSKAEKEEKKRSSSPGKVGGRQRGSSPTRFHKSSYSIFVSQLPKETTKTELDKLFAKYGKIASPLTLNSEKAFAFVDYVEKKSMEAAIEASKREEVTLLGKTLIVSARSAPEKRRGEATASGAQKGQGEGNQTQSRRKQQQQQQ